MNLVQSDSTGYQSDGTYQPIVTIPKGAAYPIGFVLLFAVCAVGVCLISTCFSKSAFWRRKSEQHQNSRQGILDAHQEQARRAKWIVKEWEVEDTLPSQPVVNNVQQTADFFVANDSSGTSFESVSTLFDQVQGESPTIVSVANIVSPSSAHLSGSNSPAQNNSIRRMKSHRRIMTNAELIVRSHQKIASKRASIASFSSIMQAASPNGETTQSPNTDYIDHGVPWLAPAPLKRNGSSRSLHRVSSFVSSASQRISMAFPNTNNTEEAGFLHETKAAPILLPSLPSPVMADANQNEDWSESVLQTMQWDL